MAIEKAPGAAPAEGPEGKREAGSARKRTKILDAARRIFESQGLEGASLRAIAAEAGYTPAALYFHFDSKEAIYAEVLAQSLDSLGLAIAAAVAGGDTAAARLAAACLGFFDFYAAHPRDLDLGFYLLRGGMKPQGLGPDRDAALNARLVAALAPIGQTARALGADEAAAERMTADIFAHAAGLLLLAHTGRLRLFGLSARDLMAEHVALRMATLPRA
jgi:AcrR family transcriptional regulator